MKKPKRLLILLIIGVQFSCSEKAEAPISDQFGYEYFPIEVGRALIYETEKITWTSLSPFGDTVRYRIREKVVKSFQNQVNQFSFRIERAIKGDSSSQWEPDSVIIVQKTETQVLRTENNQTFLRLVFPVKVALEWNGNLYNSLDQEFYRISDKGFKYEGINSVFKNCIMVLQKNVEENCVNKNVRFETYCAGVGLVEKSDENLVYRQDASVFCQGIIESGYKYKQKLIDIE